MSDFTLTPDEPLDLPAPGASGLCRSGGYR